MSKVLRWTAPFIFTLVCLLLPRQNVWTQDKVRIVPADGDGAKNWPRWRGPTGQGLAKDGAYVDSWSNTENVIWKTKVPGRGNSSPIVWSKQLFLTTAY